MRRDDPQIMHIGYPIQGPTLLPCTEDRHYMIHIVARTSEVLGVDFAAVMSICDVAAAPSFVLVRRERQLLA